jgi:8-oxo-dGTP pyrophosphatase MutT (NUDIX family)
VPGGTTLGLTMGAHCATGPSGHVEPVARRAGGRQIIPRPAVWSLGDLPPPATHPLSVTVDDVAAALADARPGRPLAPAFPDARPSAVLIALADGATGAEVLLTRRSWDLRNHRGEISFPGGRIDPGETPVDAARREAWEEVDLDPGHVEVMGELDHLSTVVSRSYIVPVVGRLPGILPLRPASPEVERVLWLPLAELVRPETYRTERWGQSPTDRQLHFFELDDETIWGATAHLLVELLSRVSRSSV